MTASPAERLIVGRVATLAGETGFGWAEAVAIGEGRIIAAGRLADVEVVCGPRTERWRLGDRYAVVPGVTDAHLHLVTAALAEGQLDLSSAGDLDATLRSVRGAHESALERGDRGGWLQGHGWAPSRVGAWPTAAMLDSVAPGRPVALWSHDHHSRWLSTPALRAAAIGPGTRDPVGGLVRRDESGQPTGVLHEDAAKLVDPAIPPPTPAELEVAIGTYAARLAVLGVTGCHDPGELSDDPTLSRGPVIFAQLAAAARLPLRVHASIRAVQLERAVELGLRSDDGLPDPGAGDGTARERRARDRYRMGWLKLFADGSMGSRSAALLAPYESGPGGPEPVGGPSGMLLRPVDELTQTARRAAENGIGVQIHAIGDRAVRVALDVLGSLGDAPVALPHRIEHAQLVDRSDVARFARLGVAASVQPLHIGSDAAIARTVWGSRTANAFPVAALERAGALIPFGTDAPVESPDPWPGVALAVCRAHPAWGGSAGAFHREQGIGLDRALRAATLDAARVARRSDLGRLLPGYLADAVVVPAGAFEAPVTTESELFGCRPLATLVDGDVVYRDPSFDP